MEGVVTFNRKKGDLQSVHDVTGGGEFEPISQPINTKCILSVFNHKIKVQIRQACLEYNGNIPGRYVFLSVCGLLSHHIIRYIRFVKKSVRVNSSS